VLLAQLRAVVWSVQIARATRAADRASSGLTVLPLGTVLLSSPAHLVIVTLANS